MNGEEHLKILTGRKNEYTIFIREGNNVEKVSDCKILAIDNIGVTFEEMSRVAKNRINFVPHINIVRIRSELV